VAITFGSVTCRAVHLCVGVRVVDLARFLKSFILATARAARRIAITPAIMPAPPFGTASAYSDSFPAPPPKQVTISAETCFNLSVFKGERIPRLCSRARSACCQLRGGCSLCIDMVRQYRKLDDQVIIRLNRAAAQLRDQSRLAGPSSWSSSSSASTPAMDGAEGMCAKMWHEMMGALRSAFEHQMFLLYTSQLLLRLFRSSIGRRRESNSRSEAPSDSRYLITWVSDGPAALNGPDLTVCTFHANPPQPGGSIARPCSPTASRPSMPPSNPNVPKQKGSTSGSPRLPARRDQYNGKEDGGRKKCS
jgi:hypothetical protein